MRNNEKTMKKEATIRNSVTDVPVFSIIVLTYLQMHLLKDCLDSVFQQTYPNIELVICDDCSADFHVESVQRYIDENKSENIRRVVIHKQKENVGTVLNAHHAVELSTGAYFKLHAGDDMLYKDDTLEVARENLERSEVCLIACRSVACTHDGTMTDNYYPSYGAFKSMMDATAEKQFELIATQSWGEFVNAPAVFWKRDFFDKMGGFLLDYKYTEDWPMWLKITSMGYRITPVNVVTTIYRYGGISNDSSSLNLVLGCDHYNECIRMLKEIALPQLQSKGGFLKVFRCKQSIWCIQARIIGETKWRHWSLLQQAIWRVKNLGSLIISWAYRKKKYGVAFNLNKQFYAAVIFALLYRFHITAWPNISFDLWWAIGFAVSAIWLLGKLVFVFGIKLMNVAIELVKRVSR